jgi:uncharacterized membrane protein YqjE
MQNSGPTTGQNLGMLSTPELVRQTMEETKELVRIEVSLAREELRDDVLQLKTVAIVGSVALVAALLTLSTLVLTIVFALGGTVLVALIATAVLALASGVMAAIAYKQFPKVPLERTRARLKSDINQLKEHVV